ncbi:thioredoxin-like protein [Lasiosphaeris hirsuta]|uniref:Thioredoxin-like protein n=1 Tax=Lasiosphaeris hirsuta TaxID=260670 RepID=A0AA39ZVR0_9PEZI|nr:thioredoxin-like protein [Lasiosphaeris hirsuta]
MADAVKHIGSASEFNTLLASTQYVVADFYADWCPPCKAIAPKYAELAAQHDIPSYIAFAKVNVDKVQSLAGEYGITAMPSFIFFKDGKRVKANGSLKIEGADWPKLKAAADKMGKLAAAKADKDEDLK